MKEEGYEVSTTAIMGRNGRRSTQILPSFIVITKANQKPTIICQNIGKEKRIVNLRMDISCINLTKFKFEIFYQEFNR